MTTSAPRQRTTRRTLLKAAGWTAAGLTVVFLLGRRVLPVFPSSAAPEPQEGAAWLQLGADGGVVMLSPVHELGQGTSTALAQIVAEELNLTIEAVTLRLPTTDIIPRMRLNAGSEGIALHARPVARAAAALREELRSRAAERFAVPSASLNDAAGGFVAPNGRRIAYGEIVPGKAVVLDAAKLPEPHSYTFDPRRERRQVGQPIVSKEAHDIVVGRPLFAGDVRLEGMAYGRVVQAPLVGARIASVAEGKARSMPGVIDVVVDSSRNLVGVVATTPGKLDSALQELKVAWDRPAPYTSDDIRALVDVDRALAGGKLERRLVDETIDADAPWDVDLRIDLPILHHAAQEPRSALARFGHREGQEVVDIWIGSQDSFVSQKKAAAELGWSADRVTVHNMRVGGAFGGRAIYDVAREAMLLARAVGRPVKVTWSRADEFVADRNRPPSSHRVRLRADADGRLTDWWHASVSGHVLLTEILAPEWLLPAVRFAIADFGATRGIHPIYAAARRRVEFSDVDLPIHVGQWRSIGAAPNSTATEIAMEALAHRRGRHPVDIRLANLAPEKARLAACLRMVRELCEARPKLLQPGFGRGYACGIYHDRSHVAVAFDVSFDATAKAVRVLRACCVLDIGLAINPDMVRAQVEGCIMMAIGQVLMEDAPVTGGGIAARRFVDYPTPRMADLPEFEIAIIDIPGLAPAGVGETALIAAVPALANAISDATGERPARLPIPIR